MLYICWKVHGVHNEVLRREGTDNKLVERIRMCGQTGTRHENAFVTKLLLVPMFQRHHFDVVPVVTPDPVSTRPIRDFSQSIHGEHEAMDEHARSRHDNEPPKAYPPLFAEGVLQYNEHFWPFIMVEADV